MRIEDRDAHNNFTLLRLILALAVVLGHYKAFVAVWAPPWPFNYAAAAVDCFFVVSGYLVSKSFDQDSNFGRFYLRRFFRIYPLYIAVVLAQTIILGSLAPGGVVANFRSILDYLAFNAVFANFVQHDIGQGVLRGLTDPSLNASLWTLKIEFGFYLLLPFIWLGVRRYGGKLLIGIFLASACYYAAVLHYVDFRHAKQLPGQLQFFVLGIAAYRYRERLTLSPTIGLLLTIVLGVALTLLLHPRPPVIYPLIVGAFVIVAALKAPHFEVKTDISYGVYLLHAPIIQLSLLFGIYRPDWIGVCATIAVVVFLAIGAERWIEAPGIALGKRLARRVVSRGSTRRTPTVAVNGYLHRES